MRGERATHTGLLRALLIDGCDETRDRVSEELARSGYQVTEVSSTTQTDRDLRPDDPVLVVCRLEDPLGTNVARFETDDAGSPRRVLMYTRSGRPSEIARALRSGVDGVFEYPGELPALCESARQLAPRIANALSGELLSSDLIGSGRSMARIRDQVLALSQLHVPVLLRGEPGCGRAHAGRLICGPAQQPVEITAETSVTRLHKEPRSYLLRDIDLFSPQAQGFWTSCLRDTATSRPVRVVATSSQDVARLAGEGLFDRELAAALSRFELLLPPLRERREDIPALAERVCRDVAKALGRPRVRLTRGALASLQREAWPENLRGLRLVIEQAVAFASEGVIGAADIRALLGEGAESVRGLRSTRAREDKDALIRELRLAGGNLAEVGRRLGISRGAVIYRAQKYGLLPEPARSKRKPRRRQTGESTPQID